MPAPSQFFNSYTVIVQAVPGPGGSRLLLTRSAFMAICRRLGVNGDVNWWDGHCINIALPLGCRPLAMRQMVIDAAAGIDIVVQVVEPSE